MAKKPKTMTETKKITDQSGKMMAVDIAMQQIEKTIW